MKDAAFTFKIGGEAGYGVMSAGLKFAKIAVRSGYYTYDYTEYPSLVRGGHNVMQVSVSKDPVYAAFKTTDFLVALNQEAIDLHVHEFVQGGGILYDSTRIKDVSKIPEFVKKFPIPLTELVKSAGVSMIMRNTISLGATIGLLGGELHHLKDIISETFEHKSTEIAKLNHNAAEEGYNYVLEHFKDDLHDFLGQQEKVHDLVVCTGNEASALGALAAGMNFAAIYPMTPTSNILHKIAPHQEEYGFVYKQPEDELAAINMAIGAAFAGARPMVATSGGGFCLMTEGYGLAGLTESPVVIVEGMRGSPATGLPTWNEQGDLRFVLHAHQGDFPRIVLAPGDVEETFDLTMKAFNLAEKYQTPVVVLIDKNICEGHMSVHPFDISDFEVDRGDIILEKQDNFLRFADSKTGISTRSIPGSGNHFVANSDEHTAEGFSEESSENRIIQMNKRMRKLKTCEKEDMDEPVLYGPKDAELTIVSWGSNKGAILEALKKLDNVNYLHLVWVNPFPVEAVTTHLQNAKKILNIECNYSAQMNGIIMENTGIKIENQLLKYDGRPVYPSEIVERVQELL